MVELPLDHLRAFRGLRGRYRARGRSGALVRVLARR